MAVLTKGIWQRNSNHLILQFRRFLQVHTLKITDFTLRERLVESLSHWTDPNARRGEANNLKRFLDESSGLMSSSALVLGRTPAGKEALLKDLQAAYLDNQVNNSRKSSKPDKQWSYYKVWDRAEKLYRKFCEKRAAGGLPPLAVLLSILWSSTVQTNCMRSFSPGCAALTTTLTQTQS